MASEIVLTKIDKYTNMFINERKVLSSSKNTISTYLYILNSFYEYILEIASLEKIVDLDKEIVLNFITYSANHSNSTQILKLAVLKSFFIFIDEKEHLQGLLEHRFKKLTIKKEQKEVEALSEEEVSRLLQTLQYKTKSFNKVRDALIIKTILFTGIRASECLSIRLEDISLVEEGSIYKIKISGKGSKERFVYITADKIQNELEYLVEHNYIKNYIATTNRGNLLTRVGLYNMISNKMKNALIKKRGVHILRHTFARDLVKKNINLSTISELLGHADITLTAKTYARSDEGSKIRAILA